MDNYIVGRNAVKEALRGGRSVQRVLLAEDKVQTALKDIMGLARDKGVEVRLVPHKQLKKYAEDVPHQGVVAMVASVAFRDLGQVL